MADDHPRYLSDEATVDRVYDLLLRGDVEAAVALVKTSGDDNAVVNAWIALQCDINNVKGDPHRSEQLARPGVDFALERGMKKGAAILLHNLFAFHAQHWDEGVDPAVVPGIVEASRRQVELRQELDDAASLGWAWWDLGMSELVARNRDNAVAAFTQAERVHGERDDPDAVAWATLFKGKTLVRLSTDDAATGRQMMEGAAQAIRALGEQWEKDAVAEIIATVA